MLCRWAQSKKLCRQIELDTSSWCHKPGMLHDHGHASCPMPAFAGVVLCCWAQSKKLGACWSSVVLLGPVQEAQGLLERCCVAGPSPRSSVLAGVLLGPVQEAQGLLEQCCVAGPNPRSSGLAGAVLCFWAQSKKLGVCWSDILLGPNPEAQDRHDIALDTYSCLLVLQAWDACWSMAMHPVLR